MTGSDEYAALRERIARRAYRHRMAFSDDRWSPCSEDFKLADAVLDALGLEQVGWEQKAPGWPSWHVSTKVVSEGGIASGVLVLNPDWSPDPSMVNIGWRPVFAAKALTQWRGVESPLHARGSSDAE